MTRPDVVIPVRFNEHTIGELIGVLTASPHTGHVILTLDDDCPEPLARSLFRIPDRQLVVVPAGASGKGQVVRAGMQYVTTERVIFADADVSGLTFRHLEILAENYGYPDMIVGVPDRPTAAELAVLPEGFTRRGVISSWAAMSGFRSVPAEFARTIPMHGYLMETQITQAAAREAFTVDYRTLAGLVSPLMLTERRVAEMNRDRQWGIREGILPK